MALPLCDKCGRVAHPTLATTYRRPYADLIQPQLKFITHYQQKDKPIIYLKDNLAKVVADITRAPLVITQNGEATFVVQDIKKLMALPNNPPLDKNPLH